MSNSDTTPENRWHAKAAEQAAQEDALARALSTDKPVYKVPNGRWFDEGLNEHQRYEVVLCLLYSEHFKHGTDGHNAKLLIARLARMLEDGGGYWSPPPERSST